MIFFRILVGKILKQVYIIYNYILGRRVLMAKGKDKGKTEEKKKPVLTLKEKRKEKEKKKNAKGE